MAKYKVISLSVGGLKNKIYKNGDIVFSESFIDADALVSAGFLTLIEEKKETPKVEEKTTPVKTAVKRKK